jgi:hypothetical protein
MRDAQIKQVAATADIVTASAHLFSAVLTGGSDAAVATVKAGGSGGTTILVLKAAAGVTAAAPFNAAVYCAGGIHVTLTGTAPSFAAVYA